MTWYAWFAVFWLVFPLVGFPALYVGYGFVMSAIVDRQKSRDAGIEVGIVERVDGAIAIPLVLLDAFLNMLWMPIFCWDFRLKGWFRKINFKGLSLAFPDLIPSAYACITQTLIKAVIINK